MADTNAHCAGLWGDMGAPVNIFWAQGQGFSSDFSKEFCDTKKGRRWETHRWAQGLIPVVGLLVMRFIFSKCLIYLCEFLWGVNLLMLYMHGIKNTPYTDRCSRDGELCSSSCGKKDQANRHWPDHIKIEFRATTFSNLARKPTSSM